MCVYVCVYVCVCVCVCVRAHRLRTLAYYAVYIHKDECYVRMCVCMPPRLGVNSIHNCIYLMDTYHTFIMNVHVCVHNLILLKLTLSVVPTPASLWVCAVLTVVVHVYLSLPLVPPPTDGLTLNLARTEPSANHQHCLNECMFLNLRTHVLAYSLPW